MKYKTTSAIPFPCGLPVTSITSDGNYLYSLVPDRNTVYKMDICGRIICTYKTEKKFTRIHYSNSVNKFYAIVENSRILYVLNRCFSIIDSINTNLDESLISVGGYGSCSDNDNLVLGTQSSVYGADLNGNILGKLGSSGDNLNYTSVFESSGYLFEGLISRRTNQSFVRSRGFGQNLRTRLQRLPAGYYVNNFFCYRGKLYAYVTKNSFHGYIVSVLVDPCQPVIPSNVICLQDNAEEDCACECLQNNNTCNSICSQNNCVNLTPDNDVSGDSTENECNIDDICKIFNCIKNLCKGQNNNCNNNCSNNSLCGSNSNNCSCNCYPECDCPDLDDETDEEICLLPDCETECSEDTDTSAQENQIPEYPQNDEARESNSENKIRINNILNNAISRARRINDKTLGAQLSKIKDLFDEYDR